MDGGPVALELALAEDEVEQRGQNHAALQRRRHRSSLVEPDPHDQEAGERPRHEPVGSFILSSTMSPCQSDNVPSDQHRHI